MSTITHRELRNHSSEILRRVEGGESITITNRGRIVAQIIPASPSPLERAIAAGHVELPTRRPDFSAFATQRDATAAEILADMRRDAY